MDQPMDIDLSLDEIIAKKRAEKRTSNRHDPYKRPTNASPAPPPGQPRNLSAAVSSSASPVKSTLTTLSFTDIKSKSFDPSFPSFAYQPLNPIAPNFKIPSREISVGIFPRDITPNQIRDMIQSTVGPVQELRLDSKGVAWVRMLRFQGWEVWSFLNGKILDGSGCWQRLV
ncbi:hypothetical protein L486_00456 [Kwoniella mangroviensis CBS 10435]|uniref:Uncharacterized protein n=1 Tax=Kwoniella mangroviensis CBS 10435 TaxID=1331196 RepID=A0A1B9IZ53_9TREE|nr:uncharacterized protein I203_06224 [Kwoniella mangroviensis CBS 8507]OCF60816.1 hypothetical protein L486_00456 [Kwoniella mangroviensis CBS 10435]OCF64493.1 hypothetical protein I203_06224 [Kwoniella mangroviensis CBS 8507]OCF74434.1 hypothetical protein I204_04809 [Kwoniella mangroviensis CBS 8886]